jgi:O-acetyl-ADP-ribose deacetylase (regulator of RNase III)
MAIKFIKGNIFNSNADVIVNPVNCVGFMGKGLALEYKLMYPEDYERYIEVCESGLFKPGMLLLTNKNGKRIIHFPTKNHYSNPSKIEYIEEGLKKFVTIYRNKSIKSIAFPQLGVGLGGLKWDRVKRLMEEYLDNLNDLEIEIYEYDSEAINDSIKILKERFDRIEKEKIMKECHLSSKRYDNISEELSRVRSMSDLLLIKGIGEQSVVHISNFLKREFEEKQIPKPLKLI